MSVRTNHMIRTAYLMTPHQKLTNERCCTTHVIEYLQKPQDGDRYGIPVFKKFDDKLKQEGDQLLNSFPKKKETMCSLKIDMILERSCRANISESLTEIFARKYMRFSLFAKMPYKYDQIEYGVR